MRATLLPYLACPECLGDLALAGADTRCGEVEDGELACAGCSGRFPIEGSIPRLMPREILDAQRSEMAARDSQVAQYDANGFLRLFGRAEVPMVLRRLGLRADTLLLEAGCGTGRMTQIFARRAREVVAIDFSFASLCANRNKLLAAGASNVHLVQADLCRLPFADSVFDRAVSCQVLEHVPTEQARAGAVRSLGRVLKAGAPLVISAYRYSRLMGEKQGSHDGGIPFFRFTRDEFRLALSGAFRVESITGALLYLYLARCVSASK